MRRIAAAAGATALVLGFGCNSGVETPEGRYESTVRARAWFESGNLKRAVALLEDLADDSNDANAWTNLGFVQWRAGKRDAAELFWNRAVGLDHNDARADYWLGVSHHERAQDLVRRAAAETRHPEKLQAQAAELQKAAVQALESAAGANPAEPAIQQTIAVVERDLGNESAAQRAEAEARRLDPAGVATFENSGLATIVLPPRPRGSGEGQIAMQFASEKLDVRACGLAAGGGAGTVAELLLQGGTLALHPDSSAEGTHWSQRQVIPNGVLIASVRIDLDGDDNPDEVLLTRDKPAPPEVAPAPAPAVPGRRHGADAAAHASAAPEPHTTHVWLLRGAGGAAVPLADLAYDVTAIRSADIDQDGVADLIVATTATPPVRVWRNVGGRLDFDAQTPGLDALPPLRDLACADFNGDRRIDVVAIDRAGRLHLLLQRANGGFADVTAMAGLSQERARTLGVADMDGDGWTDLLLGNDNGLWLESNRGAARFVRTASYRVPQTRYSAEDQALVPVAAMCIVDLDNDGLEDVLTLHPRVVPSAPVVVALAKIPAKTPGAAATVEDAAPEPPLPMGPQPSSLRFWRNDGRGVLLDATLPLELAGDTLLSVPPVAGDFDHDGDLDLACVRADSMLVVKWNRGGNSNRRLLVELAGPRGVRDGLGARLEVHAGGLVQSREILDQPVWLGIRNAQRLDALRIVWPDGTIENFLDLAVPANCRLRLSRAAPGS